MSHEAINPYSKNSKKMSEKEFEAYKKKMLEINDKLKKDISKYKKEK